MNWFKNLHIFRNFGNHNLNVVPTFDELFKQIKTNLALSGVPFNEGKFRCWFILPVLLLIIVAAEEMAFFISKISPENILELTALAPCTAIGILSLVKFLFIALKKDKVFHLTNNLEMLYDEIRNDPVNICVIKKEVLTLQTLCKYYFILNAVLISIYNFSSPFFMLYQYLSSTVVEFSLPYSVILIFKVDSWLSWLFAYVHLIVGGKCACATIKACLY